MTGGGISVVVEVSATAAAGGVGVAITSVSLAVSSARSSSMFAVVGPLRFSSAGCGEPPLIDIIPFCIEHGRWGGDNNVCC